ncbi:MAG: hypothetical protein ABSF90_11390 [Syntrophobacteraceae bacterium]
MKKYAKASAMSRSRDSPNVMLKADLAVWPIKVKAAGDYLSEVSQSSEQTRKKVVQFLIEKGFKPEEIVNHT